MRKIDGKVKDKVGLVWILCRLKQRVLLFLEIVREEEAIFATCHAFDLIRSVEDTMMVYQFWVNDANVFANDWVHSSLSIQHLRMEAAADESLE